MIRVSDIPYEDMNFVWIKNHWDIHLEGLCKYKHELSYFRIDSNYDGDHSKPFFYNIYELSFIEKLKWLFRKKAFEICVGYHWTYKKGKRSAHFTGFTWLTKLYYRLHGFKLK